MPHLFARAAALCGCVGLAGCTTLSSLGFAGRADSIVLTDASNRAITAVAVDVDGDGRRVKPKRVVCAEPSPDIARAVSSAIEASLSAKGERTGLGTASADLAFNRSVTESIAQLGSRLATIQLLRDELSDLCRAYANGAVSSITYTLRLSRLDKKMITLLVSEASAGALTRALVATEGSASAGAAATPERLRASDQKVQEAAADVTEASKKVSEAKDALEKANEQGKDSAKMELGKREGLLKVKLSDLADRITERVALETRGVVVKSSGLGLTGTASPGPVDLRSIHKAYLDDDDAGTLLDACLTSMEDNALAIRGQDPDVAEVRKTFNVKERELAETDSKIEALRSRTRGQPPTAAQENEMLQLIEKARVLKIELGQLERSAQEMSGGADRTALLRFCKTGMDQITGIIERKMIIKAEAEMHARKVELCKLAFMDANVASADKAACLRSTLTPESARVLGPSSFR